MALFTNIPDLGDKVDELAGITSIPCITQNFPILDESIRGKHVCQYCKLILSGCESGDNERTGKIAHVGCITGNKSHVCGFCSKKLHCYNTKTTKHNQLVLFTTSFSDVELDQAKYKEKIENEMKMAEKKAQDDAKKAKDDAEYEEFKKNQTRQREQLSFLDALKQADDGTLVGGKKNIKKSSKKQSKKSSKKSSKKHSKKNSKKSSKKHQKKH